MKKFIVMPENCRWYAVNAITAEGAYTGVCCWYKAKTRIAIMDAESGKTVIFTRSLDRDGNLIRIEGAAII